MQTDTLTFPAPPTQTSAPSGTKKTLTDLGVVKRFFTRGAPDPETSVTWVLRSAVLRDGSGKEVFRQDGVEVPDFWSARAVAILAKHYFRGKLGTPRREWSLKQVASRVAGTIARSGVAQGLLTEEESVVLRDELRFVIFHQMAAFNSPVWYNVGVEENPQASACFIVPVEDSLLEGADSITATVVKEARIFKYGSGSGSNLSRLREAGAPMSGGGKASGVLSWMKTLDANAGSIKSGGRTRRAACLRRLDADHPDIRDFVTLKVREEAKMRALIAAGFDGSLGGDAEQTVTGQNANNSVGVSDEFMRKAVGADPDPVWRLRSRAAQHGGQDVMDHAPDLFREISAAAWSCADPGLQFDDTINRWNTLLSTDRIRSSNPCSEFFHLDNTSCNLASINLGRVGPLNPDDRPAAFLIDQDVFRAVVDVMVVSQEVLVGLAGYPTQEITERTRATRPLGLGYGNLGAFLMANGVGYGTDEGRRIAGAVTCLMAGRAYSVSASCASVVGPFDLFLPNRNHVADVIQNHLLAAHDLLRAPMWPNYPGAKNGLPHPVPSLAADLVAAALPEWTAALASVTHGAGVRNSQVTVLAPTGTISFLMDLDTTGVEPPLGLVVHKQMVDGSAERMPFRPLQRALLAVKDRHPGFTSDQVQRVIGHVEAHGHPGPDLPSGETQVFACALASPDGAGTVLTPEQHVLMVAAVQPFLSGAVSKTCNVPSTSSAEDIARIYELAWRSGCKSIAVYRDGSKNIQVISTGKKTTEPAAAPSRPWGSRDRLPSTGAAVRHKFTIGGTTSGFVHVGEDAEGRPKELFLCVSKTGGTLRGMLDAWAQSVSFCLQLGMPLDDLVEKSMWQQFEPAGFTDNRDVPSCTSVVDYVAKFLAVRYLGQTFARPTQASEGRGAEETLAASAAPQAAKAPVKSHAQSCPTCGGSTVRSGTCAVCSVCGQTTGCS